MRRYPRELVELRAATEHTQEKLYKMQQVLYDLWLYDNCAVVALRASTALFLFGYTFMYISFLSARIARKDSPLICKSTWIAL